MKAPLRLPAPPLQAVILAAGLGSRLRGVLSDRPKGLLEIGGLTLVGRSLARLAAAGVREATIVTGWRAEAWRELAAPPGLHVRWVSNPEFATTGSLRSLALGAAGCPGDAWVAESDVLYEPRAVTRLAGAAHPDTVLISGPTRSGDEVWAYADASDRLQELTKRRRAGEPPRGELVGLSRFSAATLAALAAQADALPAAAHYEDGLNALAAGRHIDVLLVPDLVWGEVDDADHLARLRQQIWPRLAALEAQTVSA